MRYGGANMREKIYSLLLENNATIDHLASKCGVTYSSAYTSVMALINDGRVTCVNASHMRNVKRTYKAIRSENAGVIKHATFSELESAWGMK